MADRPRLIVSFPGGGRTTLAEVGGKAYGLVRMSAEGLPVPPGAVLTCAFFAPWLERVKASPEWRALAASSPQEWPGRCAAVQALCPGLRLDAAQRDAVGPLGAMDGTVAVRSSSPHEDLGSASFAGGYQTVLGVRPGALEPALRRCFASCLDARVMAYKAAHGFDVLDPGIAVIVQRQLDSEVAGVGFSLNPLNNDHDEAVVGACWGLGESVVAGLTAPDHVVLDKVARTVVERTLGAKQRSLWLAPDGGTLSRRGHRSAEWCLDPPALAELTELICRVETIQGQPVDIEWARAGGRLYLLQARPITAYVPLPPEMTTAPGQRRRLYADAALAKGLTINAPISPLGLSTMDLLYRSILEQIAGPLGPPGPIEDSLTFVAGCRMYVNLSNVLWLESPALMARGARPSDALMAEILASIDVARYRAPRRPSWARLDRLARRIPGVLWRLRRFAWNGLSAVLAPERAARLYGRHVRATERALGSPLDSTRPLGPFLRQLVRGLVGLFDTTMAALLVGVGATELAGRWAPPESETLARGFPGNLVVEMNQALFGLAQRLPREAYEDLDALAERVARRSLPDDVLAAWDAFIARFGSRGPREMDVASPRYADDHRLVLGLMASMAGVATALDPATIHRRHAQEREQTYRRLLARAGGWRRPLLRRLQRLVALWAGTRDTPKHHLTLGIQALRRRALAEGRRLVAVGRLDTAEDVFGLTLADLQRAAEDGRLDLRGLREERLRFQRLLAAHVKAFPLVIDSRGRILRPPAGDEPAGQLRGMGVSAGVVSGPVRVLRDPSTTAIAAGDVLVAYTTDPGWTPLFVSAGAVLLEVGGVLQHGAVIARELGKPCVVGIDRLTTRLEDGMQVEVDGGTGRVRVLGRRG